MRLLYNSGHPSSTGQTLSHMLAAYSLLLLIACAVLRVTLLAPSNSHDTC